MPNTKEQRLDLIENCSLLLEGVLKPFSQTDNTAAGRMITQCQWLKERAENHDLPLPVKEGKLGSLLYIYTNGELFTADSTKEEIHDTEVKMQRIIRLAYEGQLLAKPSYTPYTLRCIDALITLLQTAPRPLSPYEQGLIPDLGQLKRLLDEGKIEPPLGAYKPQYPNFIKAERSIRDIPNGKDYFYTVSDLIFNGVRPDSWLTPEDADRETRNL
ncbi:MAG: hypothetical protein COB33_015560 [Thiotrichaceae bacterium]|nr:hypothetical protein [Thiotrichaceae bacterium]PCI12165.1 MAG: hypothetical protein COB71_10120 [Thiotrichales bacterium]